MDFREQRKALEEFVTNNIKHIRPGFFAAIAADGNANDEEDYLNAYVRAHNPYVILEGCFTSLRLALLAVDQLKIDSNLDLQGPELMDAMLEATELGFMREVKPEGLFQIRENLEFCLKRAEDNIQLGLSDILGLCVEMAQAMEKLLDKLFLFHSYILSLNADEKAASIECLCRGYRKQQMKTLGSYIRFLRCLMKFAREDEVLRNHCQKNFQREAPLNPNHISELDLFTMYRNLIIHSQNQKDWERNQKRFESALRKMDNHTKEEWETSWENVTGAAELQAPLPIREMLQKMAKFFRQFLNSLAADQTYPKVIVMRSYTVDDYKTCQIAAVDDAGDMVFLSGCDFKPFTEFYCHLRANSFGVDPILVSKEKLKDWTIQSDDNPKK